MAYDERLADRIRDLLGADPDVSERKMFGGLAFLIGGHMTIAASREGGLLVRVDPSTAVAVTARTNATVAEMGGREMTGWLRVPAGDVRTDRQLSRWVDRSASYVRTLAPKRAGKNRVAPKRVTPRS